MFTGIIESTGTITEVSSSGNNKTFWIESPLALELKVDQSLSHNGVCLTVEEIKQGLHRVTAVAETLQRTNLCKWQQGTVINLERCMSMNGRLDGHIVQGHVDCMGVCTGIVEKKGSREYDFTFPANYANLVIEKGSITINGISLTLFHVGKDSFRIAIIPFTFQHTNMNSICIGAQVNLEYDVIGKYVERILNHRN